MARFAATVDVWALGPEERAALQPGQWVRTTGESGPSGRWAGQTRAGVDVVAWNGNAQGRPGGPLAYWRALREYARAWS